MPIVRHRLTKTSYDVEFHFPLVCLVVEATLCSLCCVLHPWVLIHHTLCHICGPKVVEL